jgi:hypothetical protein
MEAQMLSLERAELRGLNDVLLAILSLELTEFL